MLYILIDLFIYYFSMSILALVIYSTRAFHFWLVVLNHVVIFHFISLNDNLNLSRIFPLQIMNKYNAGVTSMQQIGNIHMEQFVSCFQTNYPGV